MSWIPTSIKDNYSVSTDKVYSKRTSLCGDEENTNTEVRQKKLITTVTIKHELISRAY